MEFAQAAKILGPGLPILTGNTQLDHELYIWLAVIYRQFIAGWYNKIHSDGPLPHDCVLVLQQLVHILSEKLDNLSLSSTVQDLAALLDVHIADTKLAFERNPDSPEQVYLGLNPHDGLPGRRRLDEYFFTSGYTLLGGWLRNAPPLVVSLLSTIFQQILGSVVRTLGEPWLIHELIIKVLDPKNPLVVPSAQGPTPQPLKPKKTRKRGNNRHSVAKTAKIAAIEEHSDTVSAGTLPTPIWLLFLQSIPNTSSGSNTNTSSIFLFIQSHLISQFLLGNFLFSLAWPLYTVMILFINTILNMVITRFITIDRYIWVSSTLRRSVFPSGYLGPPRIPPPMATQAQLRESAMKMLNKKVNWIDTQTFDSTVINERFLLSICDYLFKLVQ